MATTITFPKDYRYVLLSASASMVLSVWHAIRIGRFRRAAGVSYPYCSVSRAEVESAPTPEKKLALHLFNCAQRAHYNFMEHYIAALPAMLIAGLKFPVPAAVVGGLWSFSRIIYAIGYTMADKEKGRGRLVGSFAGFIFQFGLLGMAGWTAWSFV